MILFESTNHTESVNPALPEAGSAEMESMLSANQSGVLHIGAIAAKYGKPITKNDLWTATSYDQWLDRMSNSHQDRVEGRSLGSCIKTTWIPEGDMSIVGTGCLISVEMLNESVGAIKPDKNGRTLAGNVLMRAINLDASSSMHLVYGIYDCGTVILDGGLDGGGVGEFIWNEFGLDCLAPFKPCERIFIEDQVITSTQLIALGTILSGAMEEL